VPRVVFDGREQFASVRTILRRNFKLDDGPHDGHSAFGVSIVRGQYGEGGTRARDCTNYFVTAADRSAT
jgi:hypothetical protein